MKQKDILFLLIPVALLVIAWIVFNIYHNLATSTISEALNTNILPISPSFDTETISNLKTRERVVPVFELQKIETPTPTSAASSINVSPSPTFSEQTATIDASITP